MSAWANLTSLIKRPAVWLGGVLVAAAGTYVTTNLMTPVQTFLSEKTAEKACQYRQKPVASESQFTILVSPLAHDPDKLHTEKIMQALLSEEGFLAIPLCEPFNVDLLTDTQSARDDMRKRAEALITEKQADLLLFGDVSEQGKAVLIYAVNEHGGCDLHPKPTEIKQGVLGSDFTAEEKEKLIEVSLKQIQSACLNQSSIDWPLFARRMNKMDMFLQHYDFSQPKTLYFAGSYIDAVRLLYENGQGDLWFSKGEEFAKGIIHSYQDQDKAKGVDKELIYVYEPYAALLLTRFDKTTDKNYLDAAFIIFDKSISLDPNVSVAYFNRGNAYSKKDDWDRAIDDYTKAIGIDPKATGAYYSRGNVYYQKGDMDRAIEDYTKAIGIDPKLALAYNNRGLADANKSDWDHAIEDYTKAIGLDPKDARFYGNRGNAYSKKGDMDRAIEDYTKAIGIDPKLALAYNNRGLAYANKSDWDHAIDDYTKAIGIDPNSAASYELRGEAYNNKGEWDRAIDDFTKAMALDPEYGRTYCYCHRGTAYLQKGEWDRAIEDFTNAIGLDPKPGLYDRRGYAYLGKGDRDRAVVDYDKAIDLYSQAIQLDGGNAALWNERCWARAIAGHLQQALSDCNQSLDLEANNADGHDSRAFVYLQMGKLEDAIADYNIALRLNPSLATSLYGRGAAKLKKGDNGGNSDIESAKRIQLGIADEFQRYGVQLKELSQSPPGPQTGRAHRPRQRENR